MVINKYIILENKELFPINSKFFTGVFCYEVNSDKGDIYNM